MTLINADTGEVIEPLDRPEAERLTTRIRLRLDTIADNYAAVMPLIREAIERRAWEALGYSGVSAYVSGCFGDALAQLGVEVRREVVRELTEAGMSTRAIAPVVGVSERTAAYDAARVQPCTPALQGPDLTEAEFTEKVADVEPDDFEAAVTQARAEADPSRRNVVENLPRKVTGLDGKTYSRTGPSAPRRAPLTDSFFRGVYDRQKKAESLHRLVEDDRWTQNAEKVAAAHRNDLLRTRDLLQQVIDALPEQESTP